MLALFSWKRIDDNKLRRFRRLFLECGKSSGKTALTSALMLYLLAADNEGGTYGFEQATHARKPPQSTPPLNGR